MLLGRGSRRGMTTYLGVQYRDKISELKTAQVETYDMCHKDRLLSLQHPHLNGSGCVQS